MVRMIWNKIIPDHKVMESLGNFFKKSRVYRDFCPLEMLTLFHFCTPYVIFPLEKPKV